MSMSTCEAHQKALNYLGSRAVVVRHIKDYPLGLPIGRCQIGRLSVNERDVEVVAHGDTFDEAFLRYELTLLN